MIAVKRTIDPEDFAQTLRKTLEQRGETNLVHTIKVEPSVIQQSPHDYVVVYLTDDMGGKHLVISDAKELGENGVFVGVHHGLKRHKSYVDCVPSTAHALIWALEQIKKHAVSQ